MAQGYREHGDTLLTYNTGLYIRRRGWDELWQLFLGGYTRAKPSALYDSYHKYFKELHSDYEWVVLERRLTSPLSKRRALYRVGDSRQVDVMPESNELEGSIPERYKRKQDECLSLWHMDREDKMFEGSISHRICNRCYKRERQWLQDMARRDGVRREYYDD